MARTKTKSSKKWLFYLGVAIFLVVIGFVLYHKHAMASNKKNFQDARATIDNIYYDAVKQIGPADNAQISSNCSKSYKEFSGYRDLTCHVDVAFVYAVNNQAEAGDIYNRIQTNIKNKYSSMKTVGQLSTSLRDGVAVNTVYHAATDTYQLNALKCTANYLYDTPSETTLSIKDTSKKTLEVSLGCWGAAKQQYYRLAS